jgi:hypothetical protein
MLMADSARQPIPSSALQLLVLLAEAVKAWAAQPRNRAKRAAGESGSNASSNRDE